MKICIIRGPVSGDLMALMLHHIRTAPVVGSSCYIEMSVAHGPLLE